jgi:hypothetical protein
LYDVTNISCYIIGRNTKVCQQYHTIFSLSENKGFLNILLSLSIVVYSLKMATNVHRRIVSLPGLDIFWNKSKQIFRLNCCSLDD